MPKDRPKRKVSERSSGSFRKRANIRQETENPLTEKCNFDNETNTAGQHPCSAFLHRNAMALPQESKKVNSKGGKFTKNLEENIEIYPPRGNLF